MTVEQIEEEKAIKLLKIRKEKAELECVEELTTAIKEISEKHNCKVSYTHRINQFNQIETAIKVTKNDGILKE
jgi:hypothetical protein